MNEEIEKLFENAKVVKYEQTEPYIGDNSEEFWRGTDDEEGMLDFLECEGFKIVLCQKEGEERFSEIYVAFERFRDNFPQAPPTVSVSEPASELWNIETIKKWAVNLATECEKAFVEISKYSDGFKIFFSQPLVMDNAELKRTVLQKLSEDLNLTFRE